MLCTQCKRMFHVAGTKAMPCNITYMSVRSSAPSRGETYGVDACSPYGFQLHVLWICMRQLSCRLAVTIGMDD